MQKNSLPQLNFSRLRQEKAQVIDPAIKKNRPMQDSENLVRRMDG